MKKIIFSRGLIIRIAVTVIMMLLAFFANFIAIRLMGREAIKVYFYNKLSVAYDLAGMPGLKIELDKIIAQDKFRKETALAATFKERLAGLSDPEGFIDRASADGNRQLVRLKNLRNAALALIFAVYLLNIFLFRRIR